MMTGLASSCAGARRFNGGFDGHDTLHRTVLSRRCVGMLEMAASMSSVYLLSSRPVYCHLSIVSVCLSALVVVIWQLNQSGR